MFRCKDCKAVYKDKVDYCECGNNVFEEFTPQAVVKSVEKSGESLTRQPAVSILAIAIFSICVMFSISFLFFLGPKPKKCSQNKVSVTKTKVQNIPSINAFWDDTPPYAVNKSQVSGLEFYKSGLRNFLLSKLNTKNLEAFGSLEIEFVLDSHGNLKNKKLYENNADKSLVNAAKTMLSSAKHYTPPPQDYDAKPLTLELTALNGTYTLKYK